MLATSETKRRALAGDGPAPDCPLEAAAAARPLGSPQSVGGASGIVFRLTSNNLNEGGRRRAAEAYFNVDRVKAAFFGHRDISVRTDDGDRFPAKLSGNSGKGTNSSPKNLRSVPSRKFGEWLLERCQARPGDEVQVSGEAGGSFLFRFVRRTPEPETSTTGDAASIGAGCAVGDDSDGAVGFAPASEVWETHALALRALASERVEEGVSPPDLLHLDSAGRWAPLPAWGRFFLALGMSITEQPLGDTRTIAALAVPTRAYAAALAAAGSVIARSGAAPEGTSDGAHFARLLSLPRGTPVTLVERNRRLKGVLDGWEDTGGIRRVRVRVMQNETRCLPCKLARSVEVSAAPVARLPKTQTGRRISYRQGFLAGILRGISAHDFVTQSRTECVIAGPAGVLREEITVSPFAIAAPAGHLEQGTLQDVLRVRKFSGAADAYRTDLTTTEDAQQAQAAEDAPLVIFDSAAGFLKSRDRRRSSHWIVILDRTEPLFADAVEQVKQDYARRAGDAALKGLPPIPPGIELTVYLERPE